jgi:hypothetical protein
VDPGDWAGSSEARTDSPAEKLLDKPQFESYPKMTSFDKATEVIENLEVFDQTDILRISAACKVLLSKDTASSNFATAFASRLREFEPEAVSNLDGLKTTERHRVAELIHKLGVFGGRVHAGRGRHNVSLEALETAATSLFMAGRNQAELVSAMVLIRSWLVHDLAWRLGILLLAQQEKWIPNIDLQLDTNNLVRTLRVLAGCAPKDIVDSLRPFVDLEKEALEVLRTKCRSPMISRLALGHGVRATTLVLNPVIIPQLEEVSPPSFEEQDSPGGSPARPSLSRTSSSGESQDSSHLKRKFSKLSVEFEEAPEMEVYLGDNDACIAKAVPASAPQGTVSPAPRVKRRKKNGGAGNG